MTATDVVTRVGQIEAMIGALNGQPAATPAASPTQSFSSVLQGATGAPLTDPTTAGLTGAGGSTPYDAEIQAAAQRNGVDPALLKGLIRQESNFDPNARSGAGAVGLCQLMPGTAASLGCTDPSDPAQAIDAGARYLRQQLDRFGGNPELALAAYNAGPGAVQRYGGVPPYAETQNYVSQVMTYARQYGLASSPTPTPTTS